MIVSSGKACKDLVSELPKFVGKAAQLHNEGSSSFLPEGWTDVLALAKLSSEGMDVRPDLVEGKFVTNVHKCLNCLLVSHSVDELWSKFNRLLESFFDVHYRVGCSGKFVFLLFKLLDESVNQIDKLDDRVRGD